MMDKQKVHKNEIITYFNRKDLDEPKMCSQIRLHYKRKEFDHNMNMKNSLS